MTLVITFAPILPVWSLIAAALAGVGLCALLAWREPARLGSLALRAIGMLALILALADPRLTEEKRQPVPETALVVVDDSRSQSFEDRKTQADTAAQTLETALAALPGLDVRVIRSGGDAPLRDGTRLFRDMAASLSDVPRQRLAGVILITDGIVHDIPEDLGKSLGAPIHVLLTGSKHAFDHRVETLSAPDFALVGQTARIRFRVTADGDSSATELPVKVDVDGTEFLAAPVPAGREISIDVPIHHAGKTIIDVSTPPAPGELTPINNHQILAIPGVRDRLRVLLISGVPHLGERVWRNMLRGDPAVDLVHFTILRSPDKDDPTPLKDLSLISFPVRELFEDKLKDFDLVILDRFRGSTLRPDYLERLATYVKEGGAVLVAPGPEFAEPGGLAQSPLADILPALPAAPALNGPYRPALTADGHRHPVTRAIAAEEGGWGQWVRIIPVARGATGTALLDGKDGQPLVLLNRVGDGRIAEFLSDSVWLWARGWDGGGPHGELLRRLSHWLMREPELEEESLSASLANDRLRVMRQSLSAQTVPITVTAPDGHTAPLDLSDHGDGTQTGDMAAPLPGLWRVTDGTRTAIAVDGEPSPLELNELTATDKHLAPVADATGGGVWWLSEGGMPTPRQVAPGGSAVGSGWLGLVKRGDSVVTGLSQSSAWPALALMVLSALALGWAWFREGR